MKATHVHIDLPIHPQYIALLSTPIHKTMAKFVNHVHKEDNLIK